MKKVLNNLLGFFIALVLVTGIAAAVVGWDIYRWHSFQKVTDSDIGYWKWKIVFDGKRK